MRQGEISKIIKLSIVKTMRTITKREAWNPMPLFHFSDIQLKRMSAKTIGISQILHYCHTKTLGNLADMVFRKPADFLN